MATPPLSTSKKFPARLIGTVVRGFGRGSRDLGVPTANLGIDESLRIRPAAAAGPPTADAYSYAHPALGHLSKGIYWGFARIAAEDAVYPAAISVGTNPTYGNDSVTIEPHLIAPPDGGDRRRSSCGETVLPDFYGKTLRLSVVGFLREEERYDSLEALIVAIKNDILNTEKECSLVEGNLFGDVDGPRSEEFRWVVSDEDV